MVKLEYVNRIKRRRFAALISAIGAVVTSVFVIVSFLGQRTGSFTIKIENSDVNLTMSTTSDFAEPTSFYRVDDLKKMNLYCYDDFSDGNGNIDFSNIDNELTNYKLGSVTNPLSGEITSYDFFKFTIFVKNIGVNSALYDLKINIISNTGDSETQKQIDDYLRAVVIENGSARVFAKRSNDATHYSSDNPEAKSSLEYICCGPSYPQRNYGLAEEFKNESSICHIQNKVLEINDVVRYTFLFWLEGDDAEATGSASKECKLRLGVEIKAYENQ